MTEQPKEIVLSNNDTHPAEEIAHLKDLLGKANALARIRAERIKELEAAQAGAEPVVVPESVIAGALYDFLGYLTSRRTRITLSDRDEAGAAVDALVDWSKTRKIRIEEDACVKDWEQYTHPPARVPLTDEEVDRVLDTPIPGGSTARHWFMPHEHPKSLSNVREVVRRMIDAAHGIGGSK